MFFIAFLLHLCAFFLHLLLPLYIHTLLVIAFANVARSCVALSVLSHFVHSLALLPPGVESPFQYNTVLVLRGMPSISMRRRYCIYT